MEFVYRFYTASGTVGHIRAELTGTVEPDQGGVNRLGLSKNGTDITLSVESTDGVGKEERLILKGGREYVNLVEFYVHVNLSYNKYPTGRPANQIKRLRVSAVHLAGE